MDLDIIILNKSEKEKYHVISHMWNLKMWNKWTYLENRNRLIDTDNKIMVTKVDSGGGGVN